MAGPADDDLVAAARAGAPDAIEQLVMRYQAPVVNLLARMVRDRDRAQDLAQEVLVKAFTRLDTYRTGSRFLTWLLAIAHHHAIDALRRRHLDPTASAADISRVSLSSPQPSPERQAAASEAAAAVELALGRLRPEYAEVLTLRFQDELSLQEIAEVTDLPLGTVKTYLHRGRRDLAAELRRLGWGRPLVETSGGSAS